MTRANSGDEVTVVIAIDDAGDERTCVFSSVVSAQKWMDAQPGETTCICVETMVVDVPEYGNEAQIEPAN